MKNALTALQDSANAKLFQRATQLARIERDLLSVLPAEMRPHARIAGIDDAVLRIHVDSPVWHTRLRYLLPQLLPHLNRLARTRLKSIDCATRPFEDNAIASPRKGKGPLRPGESTARDLSQAASSIDDPDLRNALQRLAVALKPPAPAE